MLDMKSAEVAEIKKPEATEFKEIKPENITSVSEAKDFWNKEFSSLENDGFYTDYSDRIKCTPIDSENGHWDGNRGESKFIPSPETEKGQKGIDKLSEYGMDGLPYKNGEADYSNCCEATVKIDNMTEFRPSNFDQADIKLAEKWNKESHNGRNDWTDLDVENFRKSNNLSWHECCDTETMQLVSRDIHGGDTSVFLHSGGVAECKARDNSLGGKYDD